MVKAGFGVLGWSKIGSTAAFILTSPLLGYVGSSLLMVATTWLLRRKTPGRIDTWFRRLQLLSASAFSSNHGGNDASCFPATPPWSSAPWPAVGGS